MIREYYTQAAAARALGISRQAVSQAIRAERIVLHDEGLYVDDLEQWRIARIREAQMELEARQNVPSLLGDERTIKRSYISSGMWEHGYGLTGA